MDNTFSIQVGNWAAKTKEKMHTVVRKVVLDISTRLVERSPVKTGRFRANWQYAYSGAPRYHTEDVDPSGQATISRIAALIGSDPAGRVHTIVNNLPYAIPLEQGWSKQAPYGMVGLTVLEFEAIVDGAADEVKNQ